MNIRHQRIANILKLELNDTYKKIDSTWVQLFRFVHIISCYFPIHICDAFFDKQGKSSYLFFLRERSGIDSKCCWLLSKRREELLNNNINRPIRYYQCPLLTLIMDRDRMLEDSVRLLLYLYLMYRIQMLRQLEKYRLICPFFPDSFSFIYLTKEWLVRNLSTVSIPSNVQNFLQLGNNFALSLNNRLDLIIDLIKCIESNIYKLHIDEWISISNHSFPK